MDKRKLSISFSVEYEALYDYLKNIPNRSSLICKVLNENLNISSSNSSELEEIVERAVIKALEKHNVTNVNYNNSDAKKDEISDEDRDLINNLF